MLTRKGTMVRKNRGSLKRQSVRRQGNGSITRKQQKTTSEMPESPRVIAVKKQEFQYPQSSPTRSVASTIVVSIYFSSIIFVGNYHQRTVFISKHFACTNHLFYSSLLFDCVFKCTRSYCLSHKKKVSDKHFSLISYQRYQDYSLVRQTRFNVTYDFHR